MNVFLDGGAFMPKRAHESDAGYDLFAPEDFTISPKSSAVIDTGVHMFIPEGHVGFLKSKSGLNIKHNIVGEGVVDAGYTGSIRVKLYNFGKEPHSFERGNKIIQIVILPVYLPWLERVYEIPETDRGDNGFGSTGA